jgi:hypothetical protein
MNREPEARNLSTADVAAAAQQAQQATQNAERDMRPPEAPVKADDDAAVRAQEEQLAPLFTSEAANDFRSRWDTVQIGFVDDPRRAVRQADELVAQVMQNLAETFAGERAKFESNVDEKDHASTENLRVALRHYRSFFQRLLSL